MVRQAEEPPRQLPAFPGRHDPDDLVAAPEQRLQADTIPAQPAGADTRLVEQQFQDLSMMMLQRIGPFPKSVDALVVEDAPAVLVERVAVDVEDGDLVLRVGGATSLSRPPRSASVFRSSVNSACLTACCVSSS